jgi:thiamine pyrophosphate-dependent acetolactate synthase large subunit-like protein
MDAMMLDRRELVRQLLIDRGDLLVVSGLGSATYDTAAAGDHPLNFYLWGAMGGTAMIGLGLALAQPERRVAVLTGDGDMLMGLGSLATIGVKQPKNFAIVVLDNAHYGETGMQASHTNGGVDLVAVAKACGFPDGVMLTEQAGVARVRQLMHKGQGPILVNARVSNAETPRVLPIRDGHAIKLRFMQAANA